jgi:hypothetical protein
LVLLHFSTRARDLWVEARLLSPYRRGLRVDSRHFPAFAEGSWDNGRKRNDGDQPNPKGHDRGLDGAAYFRFASGWYFGAGAFLEPAVHK